jgi:hypothetical protein
VATQRPLLTKQRKVRFEGRDGESGGDRRGAGSSVCFREFGSEFKLKRKLSFAEERVESEADESL